MAYDVLMWIDHKIIPNASIFLCIVLLIHFGLWWFWALVVGIALGYALAFVILFCLYIFDVIVCIVASRVKSAFSR